MPSIQRADPLYSPATTPGPQGPPSLITFERDRPSAQAGIASVHCDRHSQFKPPGSHPVVDSDRRIPSIAAPSMRLPLADHAAAAGPTIALVWRLTFDLVVRGLRGRGAPWPGSGRWWRSTGTVGDRRCWLEARRRSRRSGPGRCGRHRGGLLCRSASRRTARHGSPTSSRSV